MNRLSWKVYSFNGRQERLGERHGCCCGDGGSQSYNCWQDDCLFNATAINQPDYIALDVGDIIVLVVVVP